MAALATHHATAQCSAQASRQCSSSGSGAGACLCGGMWGAPWGLRTAEEPGDPQRIDGEDAAVSHTSERELQ